MRVRALGSVSLGSMWRGLAALTGAALIAGGCTWVKPTTAGDAVHVGIANEVASCKKLGATHAKTSTKVLFFARSEKKVDTELETLARNEAGDMGGDTIVPQGPTSSEGRRSFDVYHCAAH
jgi:acyl dehydratase